MLKRLTWGAHARLPWLSAFVAHAGSSKDVYCNVDRTSGFFFSISSTPWTLECSTRLLDVVVDRVFFAMAKVN